jgi:hypothetical protein
MLIFDIETAGLDDVTLARICPEFIPPHHPGNFDPAAVAIGNLKDQSKIDDKIAKAREAHELAVSSYNANRLALAKQHFAAFKDKAALDATTGRVLAIGFQSGDDGPTSRGKFAIEDGKGDEAALLAAAFWAKYAKCRTTAGGPRKLVGANILQFDLPFLIRRSWILGVDVPATVRNGRYFDQLFVDVREVWLCGQRWGECSSSSLDSMSRALGVGAKNGNGADFAKLWSGTADERNQAVEYLKNDLALTAAVAKRLGVV